MPVVEKKPFATRSSYSDRGPPSATRMSSTYTSFSVPYTPIIRCSDAASGNSKRGTFATRRSFTYTFQYGPSTATRMSAHVSTTSSRDVGSVDSPASRTRPAP